MTSFFCFRADKPRQQTETPTADQGRFSDCCKLASFATIALLSALVAACSSNPESLSIKMVNPQTQMTLMCSARDDLGADRAVLATVVEKCARQLEARGFVRAK